MRYPAFPMRPDVVDMQLDINVISWSSPTYAASVFVSLQHLHAFFA
jgi:hypothetical protein